MENPFQSPNQASPAVVDDEVVNHPPSYRRHLLVRLFYGWFFGGVLGAFFIAASLNLLGSTCLLLGIREGPPIKWSVNFFLELTHIGVIQGSVSGMLIGPTMMFLGKIASQRIPLYTSMCLAVSGGLSGLGCGVNSEQFVIMTLGLIIGVTVGALGGWVMGRLFLHWNR